MYLLLPTHPDVPPPHEPRFFYRELAFCKILLHEPVRTSHPLHFSASTGALARAGTHVHASSQSLTVLFIYFAVFGFICPLSGKALFGQPTYLSGRELQSCNRPSYDTVQFGSVAQSSGVPSMSMHWLWFDSLFGSGASTSSGTLSKVVHFSPRTPQG